MALAETKSETSLCNRSLGRIGSKRIDSVENDTSLEAVLCRLHYEPTRDGLQRSYYWRFASARSELTQDSDFEDFEWDNQFELPADFLRFKSIYEEDGATSRNRRHAIEGQRILTNLSEVSLRYVKKVTDVTEFDSLFTEVLVLQLALKLLPALSGMGSASLALSDDIKKELKPLMAQVRAIDSDETNVGGRNDWNLARHGGIGIASTEERFW